MTRRATSRPAHAQGHRGRSTADEVNARVDEVGRMLAHRLTRTEIHREAERLWGCGWQTADRYAARARENLLRALGQTKEDAIIEAIAFNESVLRADDAEYRDKLAANRDCSELKGLYPPRAVAVQGADGDALTIIVKHAHEITANSVRPAVAQEKLPE